MMTISSQSSPEELRRRVFAAKILRPQKRAYKPSQPFQAGQTLVVLGWTCIFPGIMHPPPQP